MADTKQEKRPHDRLIEIDAEIAELRKQIDDLADSGMNAASKIAEMKSLESERDEVKRAVDRWDVTQKIKLHKNQRADYAKRAEAVASKVGVWKKQFHTITGKMASLILEIQDLADAIEGETGIRADAAYANIILQQAGQAHAGVAGIARRFNNYAASCRSKGEKLTLKALEAEADKVAGSIESIPGIFQAAAQLEDQRVNRLERRRSK